MTPEQQQKVEAFGNAVAQLLVSVNVVNFKMDLNKRHISIDMDSDKLDVDLLTATQYELEQLTLDNEK